MRQVDLLQEALYSGDADNLIAAIKNQPPKFERLDLTDMKPPEDPLAALKEYARDSQRIAEVSQRIAGAARDIQSLGERGRVTAGMTIKQLRRAKVDALVEQVVDIATKPLNLYLNAVTGSWSPTNVDHLVSHPLFEAARIACRRYRNGTLGDQMAWWLELAGICNDFVALATGMSQEGAYEVMDSLKWRHASDFELFEHCNPRPGHVFTWYGPFEYHTGIVLATADTPIGQHMLILDANHGTLFKPYGDQRVHLKWRHAGLHFPNFRLMVNPLRPTLLFNPRQVRFFNPYKDHSGVGNTVYETWRDCLKAGITRVHADGRTWDINPPLYGLYRASPE